MCCRYYVDESPELRPIIEEANRAPLAERIAAQTGKRLKMSGEIRPADPAAALATGRSGRAGVFPMLWGFSSPRGLLINARSETAGEKPAFSEAWRGHRCALPASCYYEWIHLLSPTGKKKTGDKYRIRPAGSGSLFLAGLYRMEEGLPHFAVLTGEAAEEIRFIHDRMPVMLPRERVEEWIRPEADPADIIGKALREMEYKRAEEPKMVQEDFFGFIRDDSVVY